MAERNELSDLNLGEFSICFEDLGGPANEDCNIEFVKSKSGLAPTLKETDMSDVIQKNDEGEGDADFEQFASEVLEDFNGLSAEEQADAIVGMALENAELEEAVEDAGEVIKAMRENSVPKEQHEAVLKTLKDAGSLIEKMKASGSKVDDEDTLSRITKSLADSVGGDANIPADVRATLSDLVKAKEDGELKEAITKARTYGFGKPEDVAGLETRIRKGKTTAADADLFVALVRQAGGVVAKSGAFKTIGESAGNVDASDPIAKVAHAVSEIRKSNASLTEAQATDLALEQNPELYTEYMAQRRRA